MAVDTSKIRLRKVKGGSGQSTYIVVGGYVSSRQLKEYLDAAGVPYNNAWTEPGSPGKTYVKIPNGASNISLVVQETTTQQPAGYVDMGYINPETGQPISYVDPETGQPRYPADAPRATTTQRYIEAGPVSYVNLETGQPISYTTPGGVPISSDDYGRYIYSQATPMEKAGLHAHTFLSPAGWEYAASYVTSYAFPGQRGPQDIVYGSIEEMSVLRENERAQYVLTSAVFNPPVEVLSAFLGGEALGVATTAVPRIGAIAASRGGQAVALGLTGAYVAETGSVVAGKLSQNDITGAGGEILRAGGQVGGMITGFKEGQKLGGRILLGRTDPGLGRGAAIASKLEGTQSEWLRSPESVDIKQLRSLDSQTRADIFGRIRGQDATVFGSVSKQSQHIPGLVRSAADVDVAAADAGALQRSLLGSSPRGARPAGTSIRGPSGHIFDIKTEPELRSFQYSKRPIRAPDDTKMTRLDEEMWRSLFASQSRGGRAGWQGSKDINRFYSAARTLAESRRLQAGRSRLFRGYRVQRAEALISEVEGFRMEMPKITERLSTRAPAPEMELTGSYLPSGASRLPSILGRSGYSPVARSPELGGSLRPPAAPTRLVTTGSRIPPSPSPPLQGRGSFFTTRRVTPGPSSVLGPSPEPPPPPPPSETPTGGGKGTRTPRAPGLGEFFGARRSRRSGKGRLSVKFGYAPSLTGIFSGSTIARAPKVSTGLELRAPVARKPRRAR